MVGLGGCARYGGAKEIGASAGLMATHQDQVNADLLAFIKA
jgi:hypothetical protein